MLSAIARSIDDAKWCSLWYDEREPRRHMTTDLRSEKLNVQRSQNNVLLHGLLNTTVASRTQFVCG